MDLTPQVLKDVEFREKFRGYDPDEVDAFLEQVGTAIGQLQARLKAALDQTGSPPSGEPARLHDPERALERVLLAAQETADRVIHDAEVEASSMVRDAEEKSSALMSEADEHSEKVRAAAAAEARRALEEAREPLLAEIADLRSKREKLHAETTDLEQKLELGRADVVATVEKFQTILADPATLRLGDGPPSEQPVSAEAPAEDDGATSGAPPAHAPPAVEETAQAFAPPPVPESSPPVAQSAPPLPPPQTGEPAESMPVEAPAAPPGGAEASDGPHADRRVVVDLTSDAQPSMAAAAEQPAPSAEGGEVIHGAFASAETDRPLDLVDPEGGPPTEAYLNLFDEGSGDSGDLFLDELRRAVDDEGDALGVPDEEADAAMAAFFDQDEEDPKFGRR